LRANERAQGPGYVRIVNVVLLIGARPFPLTEEQARWLEERVRSTCLDDLRRPFDSDASRAYSWPTCSPKTSTLASTRSQSSSVFLTPSD
jgi:hypothetical protein